MTTFKLAPEVVPTSPIDFVTVLECEPGKRCAKLYDGGTSKAERHDYDAGTYFRPAEVSVSGLEDLLALYETLRSDPSRMIIRGKLLAVPLTAVDAPIGAGYTYRASLTSAEGDPPTFESVPHHWAWLDVDASELSFDASKRRECVQAWRDTLHEGLRNAAMIVQFSASQHLSKTLKIHVLIWLAEPHIDRVLRSWAKRNKFDSSVFGAVQPNYFADPVFVDCVDPLEPRELLCFEGADAVLDISEQDRAPAVASSGKSGAVELDEIDPPSDDAAYIEAREKVCELLADYAGGECRPKMSAVAGIAQKHGWPIRETLPLVRALCDQKYPDDFTRSNPRCIYALDVYTMDQPRKAAGFGELSKLTSVEAAQAVSKVLEASSRRGRLSARMLENRKQREATEVAPERRKPRKATKPRRPRIVLELNGVTSVPEAPARPRVRRPKLILTLKAVQS